MNIFDLAAKITLDSSGYEKGVAEIERKSNSMASTVEDSLGDASKAQGDFKKATDDSSESVEKMEKKTGTLSDALKGGLVTSLKIAGTVLAAGVGAAVKVSNDAVSAYADYEQLVGGVETLFGNAKDTIEKYTVSVDGDVESVAVKFKKTHNTVKEVLKNAENAYLTAGLSANDYMETVTGFAAALTSSLGEYADQAGVYADMAVSDMSDNANKMGSSMESIQNAYNGFAKGNFTMLDNLKLGYGGTKEEMERLLRKAEELQGVAEGSLDISNFADIVSAIHTIQDEMGITGTTAKEASTTIQGSASSAKASWENLMVALATGKNIETGVANFVSAAKTYIGNLLPVFSTALNGIGKMIEEIAPVIIAELPTMVQTVLPQAISAGLSIVSALASAFPEIVSMLGTTITENLPQIVEAGIMLITTLASGIGEALPELIPAAISAILEVVDTLLDNVDQLVDAAVTLVMGLADGIITALPILMEKAPELVSKLVSALVENAPLIIEAALELILMLVKGLIENIPYLVTAAIDLLDAICGAFLDNVSMMMTMGEDIVMWCKDGFSGAVEDAKQWGIDLINKLLEGVNAKWSSFITNVTTKFNSIKDKVKTPFEAAKKIVTDAIEKIKGVFNFSWSLPKLKLPHFSVGAGPSVLGIDLPSIKVDWYKKAYENPYLFDRPTVVQTAGGLRGFGDGNGGEMVYGRDALMQDIRAAVGTPVVKLYIDRDKLIGGTADVIDNHLGNMQELKLRWEGV